MVIKVMIYLLLSQSVCSGGAHEESLADKTFFWHGKWDSIFKWDGAGVFRSLYPDRHFSLTHCLSISISPVLLCFSFISPWEPIQSYMLLWNYYWNFLLPVCGCVCICWCVSIYAAGPLSDMHWSGVAVGLRRYLVCLSFQYKQVKSKTGADENCRVTPGPALAYTGIRDFIVIFYLFILSSQK